MKASKSFRVLVPATSVACVGLLTVLAASCGSSSGSKDEPGSTTKPPTNTNAKTPLDPENAKVTTESASLQLPSNLVILPPKKTAGTSLALRGSSDAQARKLQLHVSSEAFEALKRIDGIMCYFAQTKFWMQANKGKYKAFIDSAKCDDKDQSQGDEGGATLVEATVEATRKEGEALKARIKFEMREDGEYETYHANIVVAAPPSESDPTGIFVLAFNGYSDEGLTKPSGSGFIKTSRTADGKTLLEFSSKDSKKEEGGSYSGFMQASAVLEKVGNDFAGMIQSVSEDKEVRDGQTRQRNSKISARFNKDLLRVAGTVPDERDGKVVQKPLNQCFDRNRSRTFVWEYDLADAKGQQIELNSGFQIEFSVGARKVTGNAGYNGIWFPNDVTLANGTAVNKVEWKNGKKAVTPHTYVETAGRLSKFTRNSIKLLDLKGSDFTVWDHQSGGNFVVRWNGTAFQKVAMRKFEGQNGPTDTALPAPVDLVPASFDQWGLRLYSESLDADVNIPQNATLNNDYTISYFSRTTVTKAADFPSEELLCFGSCPKITLTSADLAAQQSMPTPGCPPMFGNSANVTTTFTAPWDDSKTCTTDGAPSLASEANAIARYTWDGAAMVIKQGDTPFTFTKVEVDGQGKDGKGDGGMNGMQLSYTSGALIPVSAYAALSAEDKAKWPDAATQQLATFYRWETGDTRWSRFTGLKNAAGEIISFDRPLDFTYTHTLANDFDGDAKNPAIGKVFRLTYGGPGQLWGFPFRYNDELGFGGSQFSLKAGTKLGSATVFPVRGEQRLSPAKAGACAALPVDKMPALPKNEDRKVKHLDLKGDLELRYVGGEAP